MTPKELAHRIATLSLEKKASEVLVLDLRASSGAMDFFVICSGDTDTQVKAISDHITVELKKSNIKPHHVEGITNQEWVLIDYWEVVAHIFQPQKREFYALERLWGDAHVEEIRD